MKNSILANGVSTVSTIMISTNSEKIFIHRIHVTLGLLVAKCNQLAHSPLCKRRNHLLLDRHQHLGISQAIADSIETNDRSTSQEQIVPHSKNC